MDAGLPPSELTSQQLVALTHATRQQVWIELAGGSFTISELARRLKVNKGNIAHHLAALERVGLVARGPRQTVRGGTEQQFERGVRHVRASRFSTEAREASETTMASVHRELVNDPKPQIHVRHLRMTAKQAAEITRHIDFLIESLPQASEPEKEHGIMFALWRQSADQER